VGRGGFGHAANQQWAGDSQQNEAAKAVGEGCHQVTTPYQRSVCHSGSPRLTSAPKTVESGNKATIKFNIPFNCTNSGPSLSTYGDFDLKISIVSSAGTLITGTVKHRLVIT
jgi:hypothetical protein